MPSRDKYSDPKLRDEVKEELHNSDKGGAPGQWSARKAQMMASEYKKRGGDYNTDKSEKDESQKNLSKWGEEDWQTKEGSGNAKKEDGTQKRYLPKKAWENMTEEEKKETDEKKQAESEEGKQHVSNTGKAKESRKKASKDNDDEDGDAEDASAEEDGEKDADNKKKTKGNAKRGARAQNGGQKSGAKDEDDAAGEEGDEEYQDEEEADEDEEDEEGDDNDNDDDDDEAKTKAGEKRKSEQSNGASKKQKGNSGQSNGTVGSKHMPDEEPAPRGSSDRLPKKGQKATWKAMPGFVDGEVVEILHEDKNVDGKSVKASRDEPKIVLKSSSSGKICVHKPDACFYE